MKAIKTYKGKTSKNAEVEITANFKDEFLRTNLVFTGWADTGSKKIEIKDGELRTLRDKDGNFLEGIKFSCSESPDGTASIKITEDMQDWIKEVKQGYGALQEEHFSYEGLAALFDSLEEFEEDTEEEIELDVIGLCCEFQEWQDLEDFQNNYGKEYETLEDIQDKTMVIEIPNTNRFITQAF